MPRKGPAYPITEDWQGWLRNRIEEMKKSGDIKSDAGFAKRAKISKAALSEALKKGAVQTTVMPEIHKACGWPEPLKAPPIYVLRLVEYFMKMPELQQGEWLERLRNEVAHERMKRVTGGR